MAEESEQDGWGLDVDGQGYVILTAAAAAVTGEVLTCNWKAWVFSVRRLFWELRRPALHLFKARKDFSLNLAGPRLLVSGLCFAPASEI